MLDLKDIRTDPDAVRTMLQQRGVSFDLDALLEWDARWREMQTCLDTSRSQHRAVSKQIAALKKQGRDPTALIAEMRQFSATVKQFQSQVQQARAEIQTRQLLLPNIPHSTTPVGLAEADNRFVRSWGEPARFDFTPRPHWEILEQLKLADMQAAARIAGSNFVALTGEGALLERGLINFMLDLHSREGGYVEVAPPYLANRRTMTGTGQLPKLEEEMYRCEADDLFLIPTGEVPLTNLLAERVLRLEDLPIRLTAYTPCFRREAGTYGRHTRGLIRVHQFDKVELVRFECPEGSLQALEVLLADAEQVLRKLGLHYRIVELCTGELSFAAAKCYDIEVWAPAQGCYLEVSSCSLFGDFQARRANIRFRRGEGSRLEYVHTLNASGLALPRTLVALLETYQLADGQVKIPEVLCPYLHDKRHLGA